MKYNNKYLPAPTTKTTVYALQCNATAPINANASVSTETMITNIRALTMSGYFYIVLYILNAYNIFYNI